jgi:hypothetical protein
MVPIGELIWAKIFFGIAGQIIAPLFEKMRLKPRYFTGLITTNLLLTLVVFFCRMLCTKPDQNNFCRALSYNYNTITR